MADEKIIIDLQFTNNIKSTVSELQKSLSKLDADLNIKADTKQAENDVKGLQDQISKTKDTSIKVNADTSQAEKNIDSLKTKAEGLGNIKGFDNLGSSVGKFGKVLGGLALGGAVAGIGAVVTKGAEAENALQKLSATTGVTGEELEALRKRSFDAFRAGVGEDIASATQALAKADKQLGDFLKPDEVDAFVQKSQAIADLYDKDVSEVIEKSRGFIQNFGLDGQEAGDLIALAMRDGQNQLDDVLDTLEEYPSLLSQTGASAEEFVGILTRGVQEGARDTDRLADAIKEAQIRILAGDFSDAFAGLTEGANETEKQVIDTVNSILTEAQSGDIDIIDAIGLSANKVSEALQAGDIDRALADQINVAVSGTLAEEQGAELYGRIFGAPIDEEQIRQKAQEAGQAVEESFQFQGFEGLQRELEATITEIANSILPAVQPLINTLTDTLIPLVGEIFENLKPLITSLLSAVQPLINALGSILAPIVGKLGEALEPVFETLAGLLEEVLPPIVRLLDPILNLLSPILDLLSPLIVLFAELVRVALFPLIGVLKLVIPPLTSLIELLVDKLEPVIKIITRGFREVGDALFRFFGLAENEAPIKTIEELKNEVEDTGEKTKETKQEFEDYNKTLDATKKKNKETKKSFKELGLDEIIKQLAQLKLAGDDYSKSFYSALSDRALELKRANDDLALSIELVKAELFNKPEVSFIDTTLLSTKEALTLFNKDTKNNLEEVTSYYRDAAGNIIGETTLLRKKQGKDFELIDDSFDSFLDTIVNMPDTFSETVEKLKPIISDLANTFDGEFAIAIQSIVEFFNTFDELLGNSQANNEDYLKAFGELIGGLSQLTGENVELQRAAAATQVIISTAVAVMKAYGQLGPIAGIAASAVLAGIGAAQLATIYGAEEGVIGLNSNYNTKPKGKDNIPFLLAEGESVMTAKETQKNKELFEAIRKDPNNGAEEWFNNNIAPNLTNIGVRLEPVESFNNVNHSNAIVSELKALRRENSSLKDALKDARKIEYYPSERDIVNNINVNLPKNKSYRL